MLAPRRRPSDEAEDQRKRPFRARPELSDQRLAACSYKVAQRECDDERVVELAGDRIKIELSPYDLNRGRIVYRYK